MYVSLTPEGLAGFEVQALGHEAEVDRLFAGMPSDDIDQLTDILKRMGKS